MRWRLLIAAVGLATGAFGALRFLQLDFPDIVNALLWLVGGVVLHDAVIAPLTIGLTVLAARVVPISARVRVTVSLVVLATVTATAVPVLGRWGAREDNPTLLDRNYLLGWLVFAALVLLAATLGPTGHVTRLLLRPGSRPGSRPKSRPKSRPVSRPVSRPDRGRSAGQQGQ